MKEIFGLLRAGERWINGLVWGVPAMALMLGVGVGLSLLCGFPQFTRFGRMLRCLVGGGKEGKKGVSSLQAMCTALAGSVGTGNIAGVAGAITVGGPGAVFWMWVSALAGMCTKFVEVTLAVRFRERGRDGQWVGGPMYYIRKGLGRRWQWLGGVFALFGALAAFGIGNLTQIHTVVSAVKTAADGLLTLGKEQEIALSLAVGILCAATVSAVLVGGVKRVGEVCAYLVPVMALGYTLAAGAVIISRAEAIPEAFSAILRGAFSPQAVIGGAAGITVRSAITMGVGRGIFSNEAGLGSAPIAHAAAEVSHPAEQGLYGMLEVFIDTVVICTLTALVILLGVEEIPYGTDAGAELTISGFQAVFAGPLPAMIVAVSIALFALASVISWGFYGSSCCRYLLGSGAAGVYQRVFAAFAVVGAVMELGTVWDLADTLNGLMALPNLTALLALSPVAAQLCRESGK